MTDAPGRQETAVGIDLHRLRQRRPADHIPDAPLYRWPRIDGDPLVGIVEQLDHDADGMGCLIASVRYGRRRLPAVRPQLTGAPASRVNATGLWVGVGASVGARAVTAPAGAGTVLVSGPGTGVAVDWGVPGPPGPPPGRDVLPPPAAASPCSRRQAQMTTRTATAMHAATRRALRDIAIASLFGCMQG